MFGGDALEVGAAAVGTMGVERKTEGHIASMEARTTLFAAPGHNANATEKVIEQRTPLGAARPWRVTDWAINEQGLRFNCGKHRTSARQPQEIDAYASRYNERRRKTWRIIRTNMHERVSKRNCRGGKGGGIRPRG